MIKPPLVCLILVCGTVLGLSGIDLILPAVPSIPRTLGGNEVTGQMVIAAFVIGTAIGLLVFGNLGIGRRGGLLGQLLGGGQRGRQRRRSGTTVLSGAGSRTSRPRRRFRF